jgi:hypothetical protein
MSGIVQTVGLWGRFRMAGFVALVGFLFLPMAGANAQSVEFNSDRLGNDFDRVTLGAENYKLCQAICQGTDQCVAWTYTPSGFGDFESPQCWLKDRVPRAFERKESVSGSFPARMVELGIEEGQQPDSDAAREAAQSCEEAVAIGVPLSMCMSQAATEQYDASICDALQGQDRENCHNSTGHAAMQECLNIEGENRQLCQTIVAVEFESKLACDVADPDYKMECFVTMAAESGNPDLMLDEVRFLPSEERDDAISLYASLTQDYDYLELIEDNRIRDLALLYISSVRIGAGKYVAPGICSQLVGGYSDLEGGQSAASVQELCHPGVAAARVVSEYAENHSIEEALELQNGLMEYWDYLGRDEEIANGFDPDPLPEGFDPDTLLPPGVREAMDRELANARGEFAAPSVTQSGYSEPDANTSPASEPSGIPTIDTDDYNIGDSCLFGLC